MRSSMGLRDLGRGEKKRAAIVALASALSIPAFAAESSTSADAPMPRPAPQGRAAGYDAATENEACERCHEVIAREWRGSLHHEAFDDPVFLAAYGLESQTFCRSCHVPESDPSREATARERHLGVGCVSCHVQDGEIVSARSSGSAPHPVRASARFGREDACASCHEFEFPNRQPALMQGTVTEHRASPEASASCQSCHMPMVDDAGGGRHRGHRFQVAGDEALLRRAVWARAAVTNEREITIAVRATGAGHAVPTGDMFRRLVVRATAGDLEAKPVVLARTFEMTRAGGAVARVQKSDARLPASGQAIAEALTFPSSIRGREVRWEVVYQRMSDEMARSFGIDPRMDETIVAHGVVVAP